MAVFVITIAAAEIGVALAIVLLLFRPRATSDLTEVRELGEGSATYPRHRGAGPSDAASRTAAAAPGPRRVPRLRRRRGSAAGVGAVTGRRPCSGGPARRSPRSGPAGGRLAALGRTGRARSRHRRGGRVRVGRG